MATITQQQQQNIDYFARRFPNEFKAKVDLLLENISQAAFDAFYNALVTTYLDKQAFIEAEQLRAMAQTPGSPLNSALSASAKQELQDFMEAHQ